MLLLEVSSPHVDPGVLEGLLGSDPLVLVLGEHGVDQLLR